MTESPQDAMPTGGRLIVIRHGQTDWNKVNRMQGSSDIPLNDRGREQAREAADKIAALDVEWNLLVSSPLSRAEETARIIGKRLGLTLDHTIPDLVERSYGEAEGQVLTFADSRHPQDLFAGVEAEANVYRRGVQALKDVVSAHPGQNILAVSHGTLIRRVLLASTPGDWNERVPNAMPIEVDLPGLFAWNPKVLDGASS